MLKKVQDTLSEAEQVPAFSMSSRRPPGSSYGNLSHRMYTKLWMSQLFLRLLCAQALTPTVFLEFSIYGFCPWRMGISEVRASG